MSHKPSILGKEWILAYERQPSDSLWSALLSARQIEDPGTFFSSAALADLHDPFLFPEMAQAVQRLEQAIHARERVVIYGDYDVDGTSGTALLIHTLRFLGAEASYRIPHRRKDGYGLHMKYVDELAAQKVRVLVTVDCGISCPKEVAAAQENEIDVIITDHHTLPSELPSAFATIHPKLAPKYPFKQLSGSGIAFKLACALLIHTKNEDMIPRLTDLASLGTVADCVPLTGENRAIVKLGLEQMRSTHWDGLKAILQSSGAWDKGEFSSETIGFQVGPRINASGRMDDPYWALQTLLATGKEAHQKSQKLEELNQKRRTLTKEILQEAEAAIDLKNSLIIAESANWPSGLVGLIAGRLQEKYGKPAFILEDRGDHLVGSARSLPGFHAVEALKQVHDLMENYGGHEQAAGFHIKKSHYPEFKKRLQENAQKQFAKNPLKPQIKIDCALQAGEETLENVEKISSFAPFGIKNPTPLFLMDEISVINTRPVGAGGDHLKFTVQFGQKQLDGIAFQFGPHETALKNAKQLLVHLEKNYWQGEENLQLRLVDFAS